MNARKTILVFSLVAFGIVTVLALLEVGYWGLLEPPFYSWGAAQVFIDLVIVCLLACLWMIADARKRGLSVWPFLLITVFAGSFGPLLYLLWREMARGTARTGAADSLA